MRVLARCDFVRWTRVVVWVDDVENPRHGLPKEYACLRVAYTLLTLGRAGAAVTLASKVFANSI